MITSIFNLRDGPVYEAGERRAFAYLPYEPIPEWIAGNLQLELKYLTAYHMAVCYRPIYQ